MKSTGLILLLKRIYTKTMFRNFWILLLLLPIQVFAQEKPKITVPSFNDKYSNYITQLEQGETNIDYQDFRFSFLESKQFVIAKQNTIKLKELEAELFGEMEKENFTKIIDIAIRMLNIDYTSLIAHKALRQTYEYIGDTNNAAKYKTIQFGLLKSIVQKGDGKSCATGWPVIQISEEYFILKMLEADVVEQSIYNTDGVCDKFVVKVNNEQRTYFFEITKVFEGYTKK
jgi:hypothetical protein